MVLLGCAALAYPRIASAQVSRSTARLGFLGAGRSDITAPFIATFREALRQLGYVEGRDYILDLRFAEGRNDRLPALAEELVKLKPDVLLGSNTPPMLALKKATHTIPIVGVTF